MPIRVAHAEWRGTLREGEGTVSFGDGAFEGQYSFPSRFEEGEGTNPEEMLGAAHAACFSMALASGLVQAGFDPARVSTNAKVHIEKLDAGWTVTRIELNTEADVPGIEQSAFDEAAASAKTNCPISRALGDVEITLEASLLGER